MADIALPKKAPPVASAAPPLFDLSPMIRFIDHIALGFPTIGFGGELAAQSSHAEQQLTLAHPHG
jgi:hypothetical protein